jgi:putative photosynthetic complex assembly protein
MGQPADAVEILNMETSHVPVTAEPFPRAPLIAIGSIVVATLLAVAAVRLSGMSIHTPDAPARMTLMLRFEDRPDGSVAVLAAKDGHVIDTIVGQSGFVRGTLRGLARERRREGIGDEPPFELISRADGRLTLIDPSTSRRIDLESFGPTNASSFARFLEDGSAEAETPAAPALATAQPAAQP